MNTAAVNWNLTEYSTSPQDFTPAKLSLEQRWIDLHVAIQVAKDLGTLDQERERFAEMVRELRAEELKGAQR